MNRKQKIKAYKEVKEELYRINKDIDKILTDIIIKKESLSNYELWIDEKYKNSIFTNYLIKIKYKNLEKEGYSFNTAYLIIKNSVFKTVEKKRRNRK